MKTVGNLSLSTFSESNTYGDLLASSTEDTIVFYLTKNNISPKFYYKDALGNRKNVALTKYGTTVKIKDKNGNNETDYYIYYTTLTRGVTYKSWAIAK